MSRSCESGNGMSRCLAMITSPKPQLLSPSKLTRCFSMETPAQKVYFHYNHTDSCKDARWNARESYQFMYGRPWQQVLDFYSYAVNGRFSLLSLFGHETCHDFDSSSIQVPLAKIEHERPSNKDRTGRWSRVTFKIILSYCGSSFDGWQKQPGLNTVQGIVEGCLGEFVDEKKAQLLKDKCLPVEGCAVVAGRTDKGVTALQQVCSFYTWRKDITPREIEDAINCGAPGKLRVISVSEVSRAFHPNFSAKWRRYLYIFPLVDEEHRKENSTTREDTERHRYDENCSDQETFGESIDVKVHNLTANENEELEICDKPQTFSVCKVNELLQKVEGKLLPYKIFARDTKASRNVGPATECFIYHARAVEARLPSMDQDEERRVMCVELVANRFLRKMVRVLVATSIREAAAGAEGDALLKLMDATCRRATAPPAPPDGLCLVEVGYADFDPSICFISRD